MRVEGVGPRGRPGGLKGALAGWMMRSLPAVFRVLRAVSPVLRIGDTVVVTRYDDVREVFLNDDAFAVPYARKLDVIMGGQPFFLGMRDTSDYRRDTAAMRTVVRSDDLPALAAEAGRLAAEAVRAGGGRIEVVNDLVREVTFAVLGRYFGVSDPPDGDLRIWASRLFEFQFADPGDDPDLRAEVDAIAPALRAHIQGLIEARRASGAFGDDVLGRCLDRQSRGDPGFSDGQIRAALTGFVVGGPPQPPMVVPQALEQLLRRPAELEGARKAALAGDDALLLGYVLEAMRFDPLAPTLPRVAVRDELIAAGSRRATNVREGATLLVAFSSAMMDERRVPDPRRFNPRRLAHEYMHFGHGLHTCFGLQINHAILPMMLKPLLERRGLRRAPGPDGHLRKRGAFAERLEVVYDPE
ncbi:cytochrome P450 [Azospirillum brasilense]|uniref:cytochrome P450 n=1 Tax=Azospirillum brasilense TaxID=192 RepID=UPI001EDC2B49|nr:cytochrome P450 [Azospirillum brasilense]UKJ73347.1 cytochrome P450 [Azospirillum brasilense]